MGSPAPILICGPTAVGKSAIAMALAELIGGEIISVDSMQVYRGMDIGTAKPTPGERARVRHHLLDILAPHEAFDAAAFRSHAMNAMGEIEARGGRPILCGGTGLYFHAFIHGVGKAPPSDSALREELRSTPLQALLTELQARDPDTFAAIDRQNPRRVIRAVEVLRLTGRSYLEQRADWRQTQTASIPNCFGISRNPEDLKQRIDSRVDAMFEAGLVEETRELLKHGLAQNIVAMQAIGYRQVVDFIEGRLTLEQAIDEIKRRTRKYAKRQMTWFRLQLQPQWIALSEASNAGGVAAEIVSRLVP